MTTKKILLFIVFLFLSIARTVSQEKVEGRVMEPTGVNNPIGLAGANVYWLNSQIGTMTNEEGFFSIPYDKTYRQLIISYVGYKSDTLFINAPQVVHHALKPSNELNEVVVEQKRNAIQKTSYNAQNVVIVNSAELLKAACCNLSESFETNPAIDVNFSDALTGTKQIQMLGLTSPYLLITQENIPMVRGASQAYGLTFTPGTWVESIQITKGAGSVVNGYESISGQINVELVKPLSDDLFFMNGYFNQNGRYELNTHVNRKLTEKFSVGWYAHGNRRSTKEDNNADGFLDVPISNQINIMNRWQYQNLEKGWVSFVNFRVLNDQKQVGQTLYNASKDKFTTNAWGSEIGTRRFDTSLKLGYVFPELPFQSMGFQALYSIHKQDSYFGFNQYNINHESMYCNMLFSSIIGDTKNKFKTGVTLAYDDYQELVNAEDYFRIDASVGSFFEYSYDNLEKVSLTAGLRLDTHNRLGTFVTPRLHVRYTPWEKASLRGSMGRGRRAANIFAENQQLFASSRKMQILDTNGSIYGLRPENAWNFGVSFLQSFTFMKRPGNMTLDFYKTDFENQIVVDWENPQEVSFYNLKGKSYANSFQLEVNYEILQRLELRAAYKYYDVKTAYIGGTFQKPLQAQHRFFTNLGFETAIQDNGSHWRFDYTLHALGRQRLPSTKSYSEAYQLGDYSEPYGLMNAQVTKVFSKTIELYLGIENLTNFTQNNPVLGADNPFGANFDTSIVFAPIMGSMFYGGFRFKL